MTYLTNNALGSADPRDLYDNAEALDNFVNSAGATYTNRLSVSKPTLTNLVADANQALADVQDFIDGDIALIGAAVWVDEPTGRAAVADGVAFKVQGSGDIAAYEYRRVNAGSSTLIATYPSAARVATNTTQITDLRSVFNIVAEKNLYNPSLAENGYLYNYSSGTKSAFATSIVSGHTPVSENVTYTLSLPNQELGVYPHVFCWGAGGAYLGMDALISGNPVISNMNVVASNPGGTGGYRRLTFTIPAGSGIQTVGFFLIYNFATHTTDDFNRIRLATQLEIGSTPTALAVYTGESVSTVISPLAQAFTIEAQRNLYSGIGAIDGKIISYPNGLYTTYANGMVFGYFPVTANTTYCLWMGDPLGFTQLLYCKDSNGNFLGLDHTVGIYTGMADPPNPIVWTGSNQVVFTIPAGSAIAYVGVMAAYSAHTTADFNRVVASIQLEIGTEPTAYQPYSPLGHAILKETSLPGQNEEEIGVLTPALPVAITKLSNDVYVRGSLSANVDLISKVSLASGVNSTVNILESRKCSKTVADVIAAYGLGTTMAASSDDAAPLYYNGTYIGANHGANFVISATMTSHGKTVEDVGSTWSDGTTTWTILKIVDANTLWLLSDNQSSYPAWSFDTSLASASLIHVANATHTDTITVSASALTQLTPALKNQTATLWLDGHTAMTEDGIAAANRLHIVNRYDICNPAAVLAYVQSQVGSSVQPELNHSSIAADTRRTVTYAFAENGSCTITDGVYFSNAVTLGYFGTTQAAALPLGSGDTLWQYIPRVSGITNGIKTWQFQATENISGTFAEIHVAAANFTDANNPPDRMAQIVKNSGGTRQHGLMLGYSPVRSVGLPATRATLINEACFLSSIRKQYPKAVTVTSQPAGSYYEVSAFRAFWDATENSSATCCAWYRDGNAIILMVDFHQIVAFLRISVPRDWTNKTWTVVDKTATVTVHGQGVIADGIRVSSSATYGYLILQIE